MMFLNHSFSDIDVLNANTNATAHLYRPQTNTTASAIQQSYDTSSMHLQSNTNTLAFACQQKSTLNGYTLPTSASPQLGISYSTSRHEITPSSSNTYTYPTADSQQTTTTTTNQAISNLIPLNITIFNPSLPCNYTPSIQNPLIATQQFPHMTTIPNYTNYNTYAQKYIYKTKADDTINSDFLFNSGLTTAKTMPSNKYFKTNNSTKCVLNSSINNQTHYLNPKRVLQQQENLLFSNAQLTPNLNATTATSDSTNIYLATQNTPTVFTTISSLTDLPAHTIPIGTTIQPLSTNSQLSSMNKKRKKRYKKPIELRKILPKNSLMLLHELIPNVEYRFVKQSGPIHRPIFTMCVDISEHSFEGVGKTKKEARMMAAEKTLKFLMEFPDYIQKYRANKSSNSTSSSVNKSLSPKVNDDDGDINSDSNQESVDNNGEDEELKHKIVKINQNDDENVNNSEVTDVVKTSDENLNAITVEHDVNNNNDVKISTEFSHESNQTS